MSPKELASQMVKRNNVNVAALYNWNDAPVPIEVRLAYMDSRISELQSTVLKLLKYIDEKEATNVNG